MDSHQQSQVLENIFLRDGYAYSSREAFLPEFTVKAEQSLWEPADAWRLCWGFDAYPFIAFVPLTVRFSGPLFGRLNEQTLHSHNNIWELHSDLKESWLRLEHGLWNMAAILLAALPDRVWPLHFAPFPLPSHFGYLRSHKSKKIAQRCIASSIDAFVLLASFCSYLIAIHCDAAGDLGANSPQWIRILHANGHHPAWVDNFAKTDFVDFVNAGRVGTIVHPDCGWLQDVPFLLRFNIPVWVYWKDDSTRHFQSKPGGQKVCALFPGSDRIVAKCCEVPTSPPTNWGVPDSPIPPSPQAHWEVFDYSDPPSPQTHWKVLESSNPPLPPTTPAAAELTQYPEPEKWSGQKRGETYNEFFKRMDDVYESTKAQETDACRIQRVNRERSAASVGCPGTRGPRVYHWEEVDGFDGFLIRKLVPQSEVPDLWKDYSNQ